MNEGNVSLVALTQKQVVDLIRNVGSTAMNENTLKDHIARGAPVKEDGTMNLVFYTAWLVRENSK